jgi:serine/threonine protein kinase/Flp pilus assembly protein TadD
MATSSPHLPPGTWLGPYEVVALLGAGGMGEVYRARDTRLGRDVAVKVLTAQFACDPERLRRFEQEARAVAALSHPNILGVYDVGSHEGSPFIVSELLEGETLRDRLRSGGLPVRKAVETAVQIAQGLAAAQEKGIVHRDLKPANVFVTRDGQVKILDFGLAKLVAPKSAEELARETTLVEATEAGTVLGTVGYMSPEQIRGLTADHRSDVFSFGCVLYEMLSGKRAFTGATSADTLAAILHEDPPPLAAPGREIPPALQGIVRRCLEKRLEDRFSSAHDLALALQAVSEVPPATGIAYLVRHPRRWLPIAAATFVAIAAIALMLDFAGIRSRLTRGAMPGPVRSIAVLPLANLSGDPAQEYFCDGMTDALIAGLAQIKALKVISRTSVMQYKEARKPLPQIAKELGVEGIVEGSVMRSGNRVRITAQLIDARQDRHLWANNYEREMTDVLALQSEVVRAIAGEIRAQVTPQERNRLRTTRAVDPEAYEAYLMGRFFWNKATAPAVEKSIEYFRQTIERDRQNAAAYVGLVEAYMVLGQMAALPLAEVASKEREAALKALEIDDTLAEGHVALGSVKVEIDWDWEGAEREYKRAIELSPNYANAHLWYSQLLNWLGRHEEALAAIERARELDPLNPFIAANVLFRLYFLGRYDQAIAESQKLLEMYPDYWLNHWIRGFLYSAKGMYEEAVSEQQKAVVFSEGSVECLPWLGYAYARAGRTAEARKVLDKLREESKKRYVPSILSAPVYVGLGETDRAFESMERAFQEHDGRLEWILIDPSFEPLRSDRRFQDLRRRMKLPG